MPSILVRVSCRPEDVDCDYAVIEISPKLAREYLDHIQRVVELKRRTPDLLGLSVWNAQPDWVSGVDVEDALDAAQQAELNDGYPVIIDKGSLPELESCRVDCVTIECREDGVYWSAYLKHTSCVVETGTLGREFLEPLLSGGES